MSSVDNIVSVSITVVRRTATAATKRVVTPPGPSIVTAFVQDNSSSGAVQVNTTTGAVQMTTG